MKVIQFSNLINHPLPAAKQCKILEIGLCISCDHKLIKNYVHCRIMSDWFLFFSMFLKQTREISIYEKVKITTYTSGSSNGTRTNNWPCRVTTAEVWCGSILEGRLTTWRQAHINNACIKNYYRTMNMIPVRHFSWLWCTS